ncbi:MAG: hypothetical protein M3Z57_04205 [Candidatus Dormibacteraeota bacterium]|nr:hypothetical protein [Candidatus Dormibacteraeota bacterium]
MLIFLASLAFLLMLLAIGERAGSHVWHGGSSRYFDHCATCESRYPRPAAVPREVCPQGHPITGFTAEPRPRTARGSAFIALCAGFIAVALVLTAAGVVPPP